MDYDDDIDEQLEWLDMDQGHVGKDLIRDKALHFRSFHSANEEAFWRRHQEDQLKELDEQLRLLNDPSAGLVVVVAKGPKQTILRCVGIHHMNGMVFVLLPDGSLQSVGPEWLTRQRKQVRKTMRDQARAAELDMGYETNSADVDADGDRISD